MKIELFGIAHESIVDGPGLRFSIFTQGCRHGCPGCHNPKSHPFGQGTIYDTADIVKMWEENPLLDGITLTGGDPLEQWEACLELAKAAHERGLTVWCYTGYTWGQIENNPLLREVDVLVDGPYMKDQRSLNLLYRGSSNQRLIDLKASKKAGKLVVWEP